MKITMPQQISPKHWVATKTGLCVDLAAALRWPTLRLAVAGGLTLLCLAGASTASAAAPCCAVTNIAKGGQITAQETRGARTFQFQVADPALRSKLRIGSPVYANFDTKQVSLDGKKSCCTILKISTAAKQPVPGTTPAAPRSPSSLPGTADVKTPASRIAPADPRISAQAPAHKRAVTTLPQLSFGAPQTVQTPNLRDGTQIPLQLQNRKTVQLHGIDSIRNINPTTVPQAAKDMLVLHARTLETQELDSYVVIPELAQEWSKTLPSTVREKLRKAAEDTGKKKKKKGCSTKHISTGCVKNEVDQAVDDVAKAARKAWDDIEVEWGRFMDKAEDARACFTERTLTAKTPVRFSGTPEFPVSVNSKGVKGTVAIGVPVAGDFTAELKLFYVPCMPFALRPKSLGADGTMETGRALRANLTLDGQFDHTFLVPPNGGVKIPIQVIPIVIGGVPVAEIDVSVYVEGNVKIDGKGTLNGEVKLQSTQKTAFDFKCSGHGCDLRHHGMPSTPATAMESIKLDGRVHVKPAIYTALQLSFNWELLEARAGPQPFLLGELYGCAAASATQSASGASTSTSSQSIVADLDWGLDIRAEALAATKKVAYKKLKIDVSHGTSGNNAHLYFKDLVQSTGLVPVVTGASQTAAGQPAAYTITMPECYPYRNAPDNTLQYRVTWTGGASANAGAPAGARKLTKGTGLTRTSGGNPSGTCTFQAGQGTCRAAPASATAFNLAWPAIGDYVLTVMPVDDKHGHKFDASRAKQVNIRVLQ
jgi:hypothetical protein